MLCPNCGTENRAGRKFCSECATPLAVGCPNCGAANEPGEKFCGECGSPLSADAVAAPARSTSGAAAASGSRAGVAAVSERRVVSIVFADLVGFTAISADRDPEETRELLSRYFDLMQRRLCRLLFKCMKDQHRRL